MVFSRIAGARAVSSLVRGERAGSAEVAMRVIDARIEHGDGDTGASPPARMHAVAAHIRHGLRGVIS